MKTILLLEEDSKRRGKIARLLTERGHRVLEAGRASEATALLAQEPALIVADALLPDLDGASWLKALPERAKATPRVFISAFWKSLGEHQQLQRELGVSLIVHKPVSAERLAEQLDRLLGDRAMPKLAPELQAEMDKLHDEYGRELPAKLEELVQAVSRARQNPRDEQARQQARTLAHRLAGTAGSYGFPDESTAAAMIEAHAIEAGTATASEAETLWSIAESTAREALMGRVS